MSTTTNPNAIFDAPPTPLFLVDKPQGERKKERELKTEHRTSPTHVGVDNKTDHRTSPTHVRVDNKSCIHYKTDHRTSPTHAGVYNKSCIH
jgi:hypothetical protein